MARTLVAAALAFATVAVPCSAATRAALNASLTDGVFTVGGTNTAVGGFTSNINAAVAAAFAGAPTPSAGSLAVVNSSSGALSYLIMSGAYFVDEPLALPPQFVLVLDGATLSPAANMTPGAPALILANRSAYAAVVSPGGPSHALLTCPPGGPSPVGVLALTSPSFLADGLTVTGCGLDGGQAGIHVKGQPFVVGATVANCVVSNCSRAIWTETVSRVVVQGCTVSNNGAHAIDFDAFTSDSVAVGNTAYDNAEEGVFVEQGASRIVVSGNTLGPGNAVGVAVYNNDISSATTGHVIVGNAIHGNRGAGISVGSTGPRKGAVTTDVTIAGNVLSGNGVAGYGAEVDMRLNGGQAGTVLAGNAGTLAASATKFAGNVTCVDPLDRTPVAAVG